MYTLFLALFTLFTLHFDLIHASLVTPANVFTGCQTKTPGYMTSLSYTSDNPNGWSSSTQCNAACAKVSNINKSYFQNSTGSCQCTSKYNSPPEAGSGDMDRCASGDWDTRLETTSFAFVGCYTNAPTSGMTMSQYTGPSGCLTKCAKSQQASFFMGNVS
jgi:hypothetical protein